MFYLSMPCIVLVYTCVPLQLIELRVNGKGRTMQVVHRLGRHFGFQAFNAVPSTAVCPALYPPLQGRQV